MSMRIGLIGFGSIGATVAAELARGAVPGTELSAVLRRTPNSHSFAVAGLSELVSRCDVVVEAAGPAVLRGVAHEVLAAGRDLVAVSVGGLLEGGLLDRLPPRGRLVMCSGAVGGLDLVRAAAFAGSLTRLCITSRKAPRSLLRPWMDTALTARLEGLRAGDEPVELFAGRVVKAVELFPNNVNVAATLALAAGDPGLVEVRVIADPATDRTVHVIEVTSKVGDYRFEIANEPSAVNSASSAVVAYSVLRCIADLRPAGCRVG
jgi:aspartate dehydrogenase